MTLYYGCGVDLASTIKQTAKSDPDYSVIAQVAVEILPSNIPEANILKIYIEDIVRGRWEALERNRIIIQYAMKLRPDAAFAIEATAGYIDSYTTISTLLLGIRPVLKYIPKGDKVERSNDLAVAMEAENVYCKKTTWSGGLIDEMEAFPNGTHDDQVDAVNIAIWAAKQRMGSLITTMYDVGLEDEYTRSVCTEIEYNAKHKILINLQKEPYAKFARAHMTTLSQKYVLQPDIYNHILNSIARLDIQHDIKKVHLY